MTKNGLFCIILVGEWSEDKINRFHTIIFFYVENSVWNRPFKLKIAVKHVILTLKKYNGIKSFVFWLSSFCNQKNWKRCIFGRVRVNLPIWFFITTLLYVNVSCALELVTWFCLNVGCVWFKPTVLFCLNKVSERTHTLEHSHGGTIDGERNLTETAGSKLSLEGRNWKFEIADWRVKNYELIGTKHFLFGRKLDVKTFKNTSETGKIVLTWRKMDFFELFWLETDRKAK